MSLDDAVNFVVQVIVGAQQCFIPASVPRCCQPSVWWNHRCHQTYHAMVRAWEVGDQNHYQYAKRIARRTLARALAAYKKNIVERLSKCSKDHVWWKVTRPLSGFSKPSQRASPNVDALENFFASKLSLSDDFDAWLSTLPCESCDVKIMHSWRVQISRVRAVMRNLDVHKAVGPVLRHYIWSFLTL